MSLIRFALGISCRLAAMLLMTTICIAAFHISKQLNNAWAVPAILGGVLLSLLVLRLSYGLADALFADPLGPTKEGTAHPNPQRNGRFRTWFGPE